MDNSTIMLKQMRLKLAQLQVKRRLLISRKVQYRSNKFRIALHKYKTKRSYAER